MSSPAKRRKTNSNVASSKPVRSLGYFFDKQHAQNAFAQNATPESSPVEAALQGGQVEEELTDELLARKLQEEWNKEDEQINTQVPHPSSSQPVSDSEGNQEKPKVDYPSLDTNDANARASPELHDDHLSQDDKEKKTSNGDEPSKRMLMLQSATAEEDTISANIPFDQSPLAFEPQNYIPGLKKLWEAEGGSATYALLTRCFVLVNSTQSRIKIVDNLVNLLRVLIEGDPQSLLPAVSLYNLVLQSVVTQIA